MTDFFGKTHIGRRARNEDRFVADARWGIALVADGMGGTDAGDVAASLVTAGIVDRLDQGAELRQAVADTHKEVQLAAKNGVGKPGMGSTVVVARIQGYAFQIAWIGDSRGYLWNGELRQLTRDHSQVEQMIARGELTPEQARHANNKHIITHAMGLHTITDNDVPCVRGTLCRGQRLLLCSDGLSDMLSGVEIARIMDTPAQPQAILEALINQAIAAGGKDNITAVLVSADENAPVRDCVTPPAAVSIARTDGYSEYFPARR